jgi:PIN domain nuclease of toxin-antitoxin system
MKLLLDTHLLLWAAGSPDKLSPTARRLIGDPGNTLAFSAASLWEIVIKRGLRKTDFRVDPHMLRRGLLSHGYVELAITSEHVIEVDALPAIHADPFDRILVAQSIVERMTLLTSDRTLGKYPAEIRRV